MTTKLEENTLWTKADIKNMQPLGKDLFARVGEGRELVLKDSIYLPQCFEFAGNTVHEASTLHLYPDTVLTVSHAPTDKIGYNKILTKMAGYLAGKDVDDFKYIVTIKPGGKIDNQGSYIITKQDAAKIVRASDYAGFDDKPWDPSKGKLQKGFNPYGQEGSSDEQRNELNLNRSDFEDPERSSEDADENWYDEEQGVNAIDPQVAALRKLFTSEMIRELINPGKLHSMGFRPLRDNKVVFKGGVGLYKEINPIKNKKKGVDLPLYCEIELGPEAASLWVIGLTEKGYKRAAAGSINYSKVTPSTAHAVSNQFLTKITKILADKTATYNYSTEDGGLREPNANTPKKQYVPKTIIRVFKYGPSWNIQWLGKLDNNQDEIKVNGQLVKTSESQYAKIPLTLADLATGKTLMDDSKQYKLGFNPQKEYYFVISNELGGFTSIAKDLFLGTKGKKMLATQRDIPGQTPIMVDGPMKLYVFG